LRLRPLVALLAMLAIGACSSLVKHAAQELAATPLPIATGDYPMLGHAADFSWIAGRLEHSLSCTYLRFGSPKHAPWGGRIALGAAPDQVGQLPDGDTVVVKGDLTPLAYGTCGSPSYLMRSIEEH